MARKRRKPADPPNSPGDSTESPGPESAPGATGCEMGAAGRTVEGRNGGTLTPRPPGSNGGVHRGPDLYPRKNVTEGILLGAMIREGTLLVVDDTGKKRRHRSKIPMAMVENLRTRLQLIVLRGSDANVLRLMAVCNDIFKPGKHDKNGSNGGPFPSNFRRPVPSE